MRLHVLKKTAILFAATLLLLCVPSCSLTESDDGNASNVARLCISTDFSSQSARTVKPETDDSISLTSISFTYTATDDETLTRTITADSIAALNTTLSSTMISVREYSFTLSALLNGAAYSGTTTVALHSGENSLAFALSPTDASSGYGGFSLTIPFVGEATKVTATLTSIDGNTIVIPEKTLSVTENATGGTVTYARQVESEDERLPVGTYDIRIMFYGGDTAKTADGNLLLLARYKEYVRIVPGRTSTASRNIALNEVYTVSYYDFDDDGNAVLADPDIFTGNAPTQFSSITTFTLPGAQKAGYILDGWYTTPTFDAGTKLTQITKTTQDVSLYAHWIPTYVKIVTTAADSTKTTAYYSNLSDTVNAITGATGDIEVSLSSAVTKEDIGRYYTAGTLAYAVKNTGAESVLLDMSGADTVTELNAEAFRSCEKVVSAVLPPNLTVVPDQAFSACSMLKTVTIPASVTKIDTYAFYETDLTSASFLKDESDATEYRWKWSTYYFNPKNASATVEALKTAEGNACKKVALSSIPFGVKTGSEINSILTALGAKPSGKATAFRPSETEPAGDVSYYLDPALDAIPVWASADGKTIYYYCKGYTDGEKKKLPLNADSSHMFQSCSSLVSIDVSGFDTKNVDNMSFLFSDCSALTALDLNGFNTANVSSMTRMFSGCSSLETLNVSGFNTEKVEFMAYMFFGCLNLESLDVSGFDTTNVTNMSNMFCNCGKLTSLDVSGFNTSAVTNMSDMFCACASLTALDVTLFDTSSVTDMCAMFQNCSALTSLDVTNFDTSSVTNMCAMFQNCSALTLLDVSSFDTSAVTNMEGMFYDCHSLTALDVTGFDTSSVTNMGYMFCHCGALTSLDVTGFDTSAVTNMECMFAGCSVLSSLDLTSFDTSAVTDMSSMFDNCSWLKTITTSNSFVTTAVTDSVYMFDGCASLVGGAGTTYDSSRLDAAYAHIDGGTTNPGYFSGEKGTLVPVVTIVLPDYAAIPVEKTEDDTSITFTLNDTTGAWTNCIWIFDGTEYTEQTQFILEKASLAKGSYDLTLEATYHNSTTGTDEPYSYFVQIRVE